MLCVVLNILTKYPSRPFQTCAAAKKPDYVASDAKAQKLIDTCQSCYTGGNLLWCSSCVNSYHLQCTCTPLPPPPPPPVLFPYHISVYMR